MRGALLAAAVLCALAGCRSDVACTSDAQCKPPEEACRPSVTYCPGQSDAVTLSAGHCRDVGATCSTDLDCVPAETCQTGICKPAPGLCTTPPSQASCPPGCTVVAPFPCACVCQACPP